MQKQKSKPKPIDRILLISIIGLVIIGIIVCFFQYYPKYVDRVCTEKSIMEEIHIPRPYTYISCLHNHGIFRKGDDAPLAPAPF